MWPYFLLAEQRQPVTQGLIRIVIGTVQDSLKTVLTWEELPLSLESYLPPTSTPL